MTPAGVAGPSDRAVRIGMIVVGAAMVLLFLGVFRVSWGFLFLFLPGLVLILAALQMQKEKEKAPVSQAAPAVSGADREAAKGSIHVGTSDPGKSSASGLCKAFQAGRCVVNGVDTGPCDGNASSWRTCNVVKENMKYGTW